MEGYTLRPPDNFQVARKRLDNLKTRLRKDRVLHGKHDKVLRVYLEKGYIEREADAPTFTTDNNLYVDGCLKSLPDSVTTKCFVNEISVLLIKGGFRMRNWSSNDRDVFSAIDPSDPTSGVRNLTTDPLPMERALGVQWDTESGTLVIVFILPTKSPTRRGVLSCISSLYDPLGFVSPWLLSGKCLLQSLCKGGLGWDEPLNDADRSRWDNWLSNPRSLHNLRFPRCMKPREVSGIPHPELHVFCNASETAYSVVACARFLVDAEVSGCLLVFSKARVVPLKSVSIPRSELTAACLAVRVADIIAASTKDYFQGTVFWADSVIVLYYIQNVSSRFCTFVANRLTDLRDMSSPT
ncbi:hypothetical protein CLF_101231 [Clonorchis sinensis]|uniref:Uncharacterized protein n=1 Tax=Clonorchis sinensis TaxID=79923 RepID=G7Y5A7_CLOSI|nr:hypothetical protein CLF_101231 [Clonorchis sinensis]